MTKEELDKAIEEGRKSLNNDLQEKLSKMESEQKEAFKKDISEKMKEVTTKEDLEKRLKEFQTQFDELATEMGKSNLEQNEKKGFFNNLGNAMSDNLEGLKNLKEKRTSDLRIKAPGDINITDFSGDSYSSQVTQSRGLFEAPYSPIWLRNVLPNGTTDGSVIHYPRATGGTGSAGVWDGSGPIDDLPSKPGVGFTFEDVTETVDWIAGITRVKREMLDDVAWLRGFISRQLTVGPRGLFAAENAIILDALQDNSTAYDGDNTIPVEVIYEAAFGQLRDNYYNPTTILMSNRDVVNLIALNKASGSGEYDLPPGTVAVINNQLMLGGVPVIGLPGTALASGEFIVFDRNATEFVTRMNPEVRFFEEDRDNVIKNLITIRAEERAAVLVYDTNAIVSGTFPAPTPEV